jgi:lipase chaperone LimK
MTRSGKARGGGLVAIKVMRESLEYFLSATGSLVVKSRSHCA